MKKLIFVLMLVWALLSTLRAQATAQMPDSIVIEGQRYSLTTLPLAEFLKGRKGFPPKDAARSSANWRGYIADWKIDGKMLYLTDVTIR